MRKRQSVGCSRSDKRLRLNDKRNIPLVPRVDQVQISTQYCHSCQEVERLDSCTQDDRSQDLANQCQPSESTLLILRTRGSVELAISLGPRKPNSASPRI